MPLPLLADIVPLIRMPATQRGVFTYRVPDTLAPRITRGAFVRIPFRKRRVWGICIAAPSPVQDAIRGLRDILSIEASWSLAQDEVHTIERLASHYRISMATAAYLLIPSPPNALRAKSQISNLKSQITQPPPQLKEQTGVATQKETGDDTIVVYYHHGQRIAAMRELAQRCISHGASALIITPHRAWLNPLSQALGGLPLVTMDTGTHGVHASWDAAAAARTPGVVILGTRAAAWIAPPSLGAIILDEAHSDDHKQWDMQPKYDARVLTSAVAKARGIPRYLLSPAPRVEDWVRAAHHTTLDAEPLDVRIARLDYFWRSGGRGFLTDDLLDAIRTTMTGGRTVLLLHNRRGRMGRLVCADCEAVALCAACGQPLAEYEEGMRCRVCAAPSAPLEACPTCASPLLRGRTIGTVGIVELLRKRFPTARIARVDRDAPDAPPDDTQIIVATERYTTSIAPTDSHSIGLVATLHAERYVRGDDYRTNERLLTALRDMAVWARTWNASMMVQTADLTHPAIAALTGDLAPFMDAEARERTALHYPPATRLIRFDTTDAEAAARGGTFRSLLEREYRGTITHVTGPFSYGVVRRRPVTSVLAQVRNDAPDEAVTTVVTIAPPAWSIDVDPVALHA